MFHYVELFNRRGEYKAAVQRVVGDDFIDRNLLILDRLEILPDHRKKRLGLACLYRCIQQYRHGCSFVALKAFPLQFEADNENPPVEDWRRRLNLNDFGSDW